MTVGELKKELEKYDDELKVIIHYEHICIFEDEYETKVIIVNGK